MWRDDPLYCSTENTPSNLRRRKICVKEGNDCVRNQLKVKRNGRGDVYVFVLTKINCN